MHVRKCLSLGKENIKTHQVMYLAIYLLCRLAIFLVLDIYMYYIQPELWIGDYRFGSGKGARPLKRERPGSKEAQRSSKGSGSLSRKWHGIREPNLAASYPAIAPHVIYKNIEDKSLSCSFAQIVRYHFCNQF